MLNLPYFTQRTTRLGTYASVYFASLLAGCRKRRLTGRRSASRAEGLEYRTLLTVFTVNSLADGVGVGGAGVTTLREAVLAASTNSSVDGSAAGSADGDLIRFDTGIFGGGGTISLNAMLGDLLISDDVVIDGAMGNGGPTMVTIDGGGATRLFSVNTTAAPGSATVTFTGLTLQGGDGTGNVAANDGRGGAIYIGSSNGVVRVVNTTIDNNTASGAAATDGGGGIYNTGGRLALTNTTITNNTADGAAGSGGGIFSTAGLVTIAGGSVSSNTANRAGGGIELVNGNLETSNVTFDGNVAGPMGMAAPGNGGALHVSGNNALVYINGGAVTNNTAALEGGGLWNQSGSNMVVRANVTISGNTAGGNAADDGGGGLFNNGGSLVVVDSSVTNNTATGSAGSGGGILSTSGTLRVERTSVTGNTALRAGGGIEIGTGIVRLVGVNLDNNDALGSMMAPGNGGGMHITGNANVYLTGGTVNNNTAALEGGGLWNSTGLMVVRGNIVIDGNTASGMASHDGGGGIFNNGGRLAVTDATISNNTADGASGSGGGIFSTAGLVSLGNVMLNSNTANRAGGGIELINGNLDAVDSTFDGNIAGPMGLAAPGNGGAFHVTGNSSQIFISGGTVTNNVAANEGGGLWNQSGSTMIVRANTLVDGNTAMGPSGDDGGGGIFNNGGTLTIVDSTISNNDATGTAGSGGGVLSTAGTVRVERSMITGNTAIRAGGGIELVMGTLRLVNTNLDMNSALGGGMGAPGNGGGFHVTNSADVVITGGTVNGNSAALEGGGLWNSTGTMLVQNNVTINGNTANGAAGDDGGGGIFNNGGTLTVTGSTISNNSATGMAGSGGGVFSTAGNVTITNSTISFNSAQRAGGGIEIINGALTLNNTNLLTNDALGGGMGAPGNGGALHITGTTTTSIVGGTVFNNFAAAEGGGLWNQSGSTMTVDGTTILANIAEGSMADQGGGGIFNNGGVLNVTNATIDGNLADVGSGSGGGIFNDVGGVINISNTSIVNNVANRAGGGIEDNSGAGLGVVLTNVTLDGNNAGVAPDATAAPGNGGGLHVTGAGDVIISGGTVNDNVAAQEGGGLWNGSGTMTVIGTTLNNNTASGVMSHDGGGGIFNNGGTLIVTDATITNNVADGTAGSGGGLFSLAGTVTISNSLIGFNSANRAGGGIEIVDGNLTSVDTNFITNDALGGAMGAPGNGGGVHVSGMSTTTSFTGGVVFNNFAAAEGGGLWNQAGSTMIVSGTLIDSNLASGNAANEGGGGIFNNGGDVLVLGGTVISFNGADGTSGSGGGILNDAGGTLTILGSVANPVTIVSNDAQRAGGGIETVDGTVTLNYVLLTTNDVATGAAPGNGGGLHITGAGNVSLLGSVVSGNIAVEGGGLWASDTGTLTVTNSTISNNDASSMGTGGGGIHVDAGAMGAGSLNVIGSTISGNTATNNGAGIHFENGFGTMQNSTVSGNTTGALGGGGGIFVANGTLDINSITVFNNNTVLGFSDQIFIGGPASVLSRNSIYADTSAGMLQSDALEGIFAMGSDFNLTSDADNGNFMAAASNIFETNPNLGLLADNGGPLTASGVATLTHLPNMGSAAIDAGDTGLGFDQRGFLRAGTDDIGAVTV